MIAILRRKFPPILTIKQIQEGLRIAKRLNIEEAIAIEAEEGEKEGSIFKTNQKDITTAGIAERLTASNIKIPEGMQVTVIAKPGNTGVIYFGNSKENCEDTSKRFDGLSPGLAHSFVIGNVNEIWVDAAADGDGVSWYVEQ